MIVDELVLHFEVSEDRAKELVEKYPGASVAEIVEAEALEPYEFDPEEVAYERDKT